MVSQASRCSPGPAQTRKHISRVASVYPIHAVFILTGSSLASNSCLRASGSSRYFVFVRGEGGGWGVRAGSSRYLFIESFVSVPLCNVRHFLYTLHQSCLRIQNFVVHSLANFVAGSYSYHNHLFTCNATRGQVVENAVHTLSLTSSKRRRKSIRRASTSCSRKRRTCSATSSFVRSMSSARSSSSTILSTSLPGVRIKSTNSPDGWRRLNRNPTPCGKRRRSSASAPRP